VQQLLKASPAEMRYICRASATLLVRDPGYLANNIAEIAQMLQLTEASTGSCGLLGGWTAFSSCIWQVLTVWTPERLR
jgi:hypothetical protein